MRKFGTQTSSGEVTILVLTKEEWKTILEDIRTNYKSSVVTITDDNIKSFDEVGIIPLIKKGKATSYLFTKYEVQTELMMVCRQGIRKDFLKKFGLEIQEANGHMSTELDKINKSLPQNLRDLIDQYTPKIAEAENPVAGLEEFLAEVMKFYPGIDFDVDNLLNQLINSAAFTWTQYNALPDENRKSMWSDYIKRLITGGAGSIHVQRN